MRKILPIQQCQPSLSVHVVLTPAQLKVKGITKSDVVRMLKYHEKRVQWYINNDTGSPWHKSEWDAACQRWDHMKATLNQFP